MELVKMQLVSKCTWPSPVPVSANKVYVSFSFYGANHCVPFWQNPSFLRKYDCWFSNYWLSHATGNYWHNISSVISKLSTRNKVQYIAKACRYNISENRGNVFGTTLVPSVISWWGGLWQRSVTWQLLSLILKQPQTWNIDWRVETLGLKHIPG